MNKRKPVILDKETGEWLLKLLSEPTKEASQELKDAIEHYKKIVVRNK